MEVRSVILKIGTAIQMIKENEKTEEIEEYKSRVIDIGEDHIMIDYPSNIETGKTVFLMDETELLITFTDELKMSYRFHTRVQGRRLAGIPMLQISYVGDDKLIKVQRREFVRVDVSVDVAVEKDADILRLVTTDLSAGGLAVNLSTADLLQEDDLVSLLIVLPFAQREIEYIRVKARVVRVFERDQRHIASLEFIELPGKERRNIIQFCFERQLQMKKKMK